MSSGFKSNIYLLFHSKITKLSNDMSAAGFSTKKRRQLVRESHVLDSFFFRCCFYVVLRLSLQLKLKLKASQLVAE